jgi:hypothetical protein
LYAAISLHLPDKVAGATSSCGFSLILAVMQNQLLRALNGLSFNCCLVFRCFDATDAVVGGVFPRDRTVFAALF